MFGNIRNIPTLNLAANSANRNLGGVYSKYDRMAGFITMAVTPNYGWPVPVATDFVKDGYEAIADLGDAIDATVFGLPAGGLTLINTTSFSAVASQNFESVFSATYDNYQIVFNFSGSTSAIALFRISSGASPITTGSYNRKRIYSGTNSTSILQTNGAGQTSIEIGDITGTATTGFVGGSMTVNKPFLATRTGIAGSCVAATTADNFLSLFGGYQSDSTSYDGFALTCSTGTITGTASVYGYQK
jgi:hypothetical protein